MQGGSDDKRVGLGDVKICALVKLVELRLSFVLVYFVHILNAPPDYLVSAPRHANGKSFQNIDGVENANHNTGDIAYVIVKDQTTESLVPINTIHSIHYVIGDYWQGENVD